MNTAESTTSKPPLSVTLRGTEVLQCIQFDLVPQDKGQAVVVVGVMEGSSAEQAGVRPGQRLRALSDPMRYGTMWELQDRPSLRFVMDTLKMRRSQAIDLDLEEFLSNEEYQALLAARAEVSRLEDGGALMALTTQGTTSEEEEDQGSAAGGRAAGSAGASTASSGGKSIGERLAQQYAEAERSKQAVSDVQKRMLRRKEYMEDVSQRNDSGFSLLLLAFFVLPPLVILLIASSTGYLDHLFSVSLTLR